MKSRTGTRTLNIAVVVAVLVALLTLGATTLNLFAPTGKRYSPIEEAALAAANCISAIVVNTPECGYISLSDHAPDGTATDAKDGFSLPVRSINSIIGMSRLELIVADKLEQSLLEEFAEKDLKDALAAKDQLITVIKKSLVRDGSAADRNGKVLKPYLVALTAYNEFSGQASKQETLVLKLGSLEGGAATQVPVPQPIQSAPVASSAAIDGFYRSYVNVPYKEIDFVFGGIGKVTELVDPNKWKEKIDSLPYQIPTIVKAEVLKSGKVQVAACAQPASETPPPISSAALTISFPDGPVPEIKTPADCYMLEALNSTKAGSMDLLTCKDGDYPLDSGANMTSMNWPLTDGSSFEPTANVWRLALHDWIRRAGPSANIDSIVQMQKIELDHPKPAKVMWRAPLQRGYSAERIEPISSGIIHIFEFDEDGVVVYRSKILTPYPLNVVCQNQMYGEQFGALTFSDIGVQTIMIPMTPAPKKVTLRAVWDVYIRDQVRSSGTIRGGKHGGEPIAKPVLAEIETASINTPTADGQVSEESKAGGTTSPQEPVGTASSQEAVSSEEVDPGKGHGAGKGKGMVGVIGRSESGCPPLLAPQSDFGEGMNPPPPFVKPMPIGSGMRPFARTGGTAVDITFRRQVDASDLNGFTSSGYIGIIEIEDEPKPD